MGTGPCFGDSGTSRSRRLRRLKSRRIASDPKESGLEHERTFLGLLKNGETEVGIPALAKTPSFRSNPFSERIFQLFATSEEANRMSLPEYKAAVKELDFVHEATSLTAVADGLADPSRAPARLHPAHVRVPRCYDDYTT